MDSIKRDMQRVMNDDTEDFESMEARMARRRNQVVGRGGGSSLSRQLFYSQADLGIRLFFLNGFRDCSTS